jgi:hypothetical protein
MDAVKALAQAEPVTLEAADLADTEQLLLLLAGIVTRLLGVESRGENQENQAR